MKSALFGCRGFVGSNLSSQYKFTNLYNSSNFQESQGMSFDLVVLAAARAVKWKINQEPREDEKHISALKSIVDNLSCQKLILISTVDVFDSPIEVNEQTLPRTDNSEAYGRNRLDLEHHVRNQIDDHLIVRLPGLYGKGLKKNVIYDLMYRNRIEQINPMSQLQYYGLSNLWGDIEISLKNQLKTIHLATEPLTSEELARKVFNIDITRQESKNPVAYDFRTIYSELFGSQGHYIQTKTEVLSKIENFVNQENTVIS